MPDSIQTARSVLALAREEILARPNVVAAGVGLKQTTGASTPTPCIVCSVAEKRAVRALALRECLPDRFDDVPTDVVQTGRLRAFGVRTDRHRPAPGGVSIGHRRITAGTLGCLVRRDGLAFILSNNHVLANSNDAHPGDAILQPGPHDGGRYPEDHIADLAAFMPISFIGGRSASACARLRRLLSRLLGRRAGREDRVLENLVDAAIALPLDVGDVSGEILEIGTIVDIASAELGMPVQKSGRTTALTRGAIQQVDVTAHVEYGRGRVARFGDQLLAGPMSRGGDSGSAVLDEHGRLVGLLFGGSDNTTVINRIENVFASLGLEPCD